MNHDDVLAAVPQQAPFRFIEKIDSLDEDHIVGRYTFKPDEFFYAGHFPGAPVTPGVILIETMAQTGVVALGLFLTSKSVPAEEVHQWLTLFSECQVDFLHPVMPGDEVIVRASKVFFRRMKLKCRVTLELADGTLAAEGTLAGVGVKKYD
ncbi:MAG: hotdog domain-containing protein [Pseudomonadota bacterium]